MSAEAAAALGRAAARITRRAGSPLALLTGAGPPRPLRHYPQGDVYDPDSHAQYYFHTHRAAEAGHLHLFLRPGGMPAGIRPRVPTADPDAPCHLVAVGLGADGWPDHLFTTNRWVTGEAWYAADAVAAMLPGFRVAGGGRLAPLSAWLTALVTLTAPLIARLAAERDAAVARRAAVLGLAALEDGVLEDGALEITSRAPLDLGALVPAALGG